MELTKNDPKVFFYIKSFTEALQTIDHCWLNNSTQGVSSQTAYMQLITESKHAAISQAH